MSRRRPDGGEEQGARRASYSTVRVGLERLRRVAAEGRGTYPWSRRSRVPGTRTAITPEGAGRLRLRGRLHPRGAWDDGPGCFAFAPEGERVALGRGNKTVSVHDLNSGRTLMRGQGRRFFHENGWLTNVVSGAEPPSVRSVAFADGRTLLMAVAEDYATVWDVPSGRERYTLRGRRQGEAEAPDVVLEPPGREGKPDAWPEVRLTAVPAPDGATLVVHAVRRSGERTELRAVRDGSLLHAVEHAQATGSVPRTVVSPDGGWFALPVGTASERVTELRRLDAPETVMRIAGGWPVVFTPDGQRLAAAEATQIRAWEAASGRELWRTGEALEYVRTLCWAAGGAVLAAETNREDGSLGAVRCWDGASGRLLGTLTSEARGPVVDIAASPDGRLLAVARYWSVEVWEVATLRRVYRWAREGEEDLVIPAHGTCAFSPDGAALGVLTRKGLGVWRVAG